MLGMCIVQYAVVAWRNLDIGALSTPCENLLLIAKVSLYCFFADPLGVGHIPRVLWALEQSHAHCCWVLALGQK